MQFLEGSFSDGAYLQNNKKVILTECLDSKCFLADPKTNSMDLISNKVSGSDIPNKTLKISRNEKIALLNNKNNIEAKIMHEKGLLNTKIIIDTYKTMGVEIDDFDVIGSDKCLIITTDGKLAVVKFDITNETWQQVFELDLNKGVDSRRDRLNVNSYALSAFDDCLAVSTSTDYDHGEKLRKIYLFGVSESGALEQLCVKDFGEDQPEASFYSYLNLDYFAHGRPVLLALQGGDRYNLDAYAFKKDQTLELIYSEEGYHESDFSAVRSFENMIYSVDFNGNMRVLALP